LRKSWNREEVGTFERQFQRKVDAMKTGVGLVVAACFALGTVPAVGQVEPGQPGSPQTIPEKDRTRPEDWPKADMPVAPQENGMTTGRSLSDRLDESGGVIKPPKGVDPEMVKPAPETNTTPVIPPPGMGAPGPEPK
jgi:hypothetical protein